jgi:uncharacterized RDD family membrane protein YckC
LPVAAVAPLDPAIRVETPEGIEISLQPAGLPARGCAWLLDALLRAAILYVVAILTRLFGNPGTAFYLVAAFLVEWFYPVLFELLPRSATPGKRVMALRVVMGNGLPVTVAAALARNLLRAADFLPLGYAVGAACVLLRPDLRRLGDLVADTRVVHVPRPVPARVPEGVEPIQPAIPLSTAAQQALVRLVLRAGTINPERLDEVAALAAPAAGDGAAPGAALTRRVLGVGYWLMGGRRA